MITQLPFSFLLRMILFSLFVLFVVSISFVKISVSHGWDVLMFFNPLDLFHNYVEEAVTHYLDPIRGNHPEAFTRSRKVSLSKLLFKMTDRRLNRVKLTLYLGRLVGLFLIKTFLKNEVYSTLKLCMLWRMGSLRRFMTTLMTVFRSGMILSL